MTLYKVSKKMKKVSNCMIVRTGQEERSFAGKDFCIFQIGRLEQKFGVWLWFVFCFVFGFFFFFFKNQTSSLTQKPQPNFLKEIFFLIK